MYTRATFRISEALASPTHASRRDILRRFLTDLDSPVKYSGQRFDQCQALASFLFELCKSGAEADGSRLTYSDVVDMERN